MQKYRNISNEHHVLEQLADFAQFYVEFASIIHKNKFGVPSQAC